MTLDLTSLTHFMAVARQQNLALAAQELHLTPSAISKSLKRLETSLRTPLFDREGRALQLNADGKKLFERALPLLASAEQLHAEFAGEWQAYKCRIAAPPLLHLHWGQLAIDFLQQHYPQASVTLSHSNDEQTIASVLAGDADMGLIIATPERTLHPRLALLPLGQCEFRVACGAQHPLARRTSALPIAKLLEYDFVAPLHPPFSSLNNQTATDGWRDDVFPRSVRYRSDDMLMVQSLLQRGQALSYLPDDVIALLGLHTVRVSGCPYQCVQPIAMIYRPALELKWLLHLVEYLEKALPL